MIPSTFKGIDQIQPICKNAGNFLMYLRKCWDSEQIVSSDMLFWEENQYLFSHGLLVAFCTFTAPES